MIIIGSGILDEKARRRFRLARRARDKARRAVAQRAFQIKPPFKASFDPGLGRYIASRTERRETMKELALQEA